MTTHPMPLATLLAYALPAVPLAALTLPLYVIVPTFYTETLGLPLAAVGAALLVVRLCDAVTDPVIGYASDAWRPPFGRRRTFFLMSIPLTVLAAVMLFWPPASAGTGWLLLWGTALSVGYTGTLLPYTAWGAELAGDYRERSRVAGFREGFTLVGTLVAIALPFAIGFSDADGLHGLAILGLTVATALVVLGVVAAWVVPEPVEYTVKPVRPLEGLHHMRSNGPFVRLIFAFFLNGLANGIPATLFLYFVSDRLGAPELRGPLLFAYFLAGVAGVPLALWAAGRVGKHRAWCIAMLATCAVFACVPLLGRGDVMAFAAISALTGLALGFDLSLPASIQADVIDVDTAASGEQRTGFYYAAWSLATKLSLAAGVGLVFPLLGFFGFQAGPDATNSETAISALTYAYAWLPVVLKLAAIALMWNFPLDEAEQKRLRQTIEGRSKG